MNDDEATADNESRPAVGAPVQRPVRPCAWRWRAVKLRGHEWRYTANRTRDDSEAVYDAATVERLQARVLELEAVHEDASGAVLHERERMARDVAGLHMAQSLNHQNHPSAWHDGVDAALAVIRGA